MFNFCQSFLSLWSKYFWWKELVWLCWQIFLILGWRRAPAGPQLTGTRRVSCCSRPACCPHSRSWLVRASSVSAPSPSSGSSCRDNRSSRCRGDHCPLRQANWEHFSFVKISKYWQGHPRRLRKRFKDKRKQRSLSRNVTIILSYHHHHPPPTITLPPYPP